MDKITATRVYEEELRENEYKRIEKIIKNYSDTYRPEKQFLLGTIFIYDLDYPIKYHCNRYYIITFVTIDKIYYKQLYAQKYHPSWESKQLTQNYKEYSRDHLRKYVFKYNESLKNEYDKNSLTINEFYDNTICFKSSEIYEIVFDNHLHKIETIEIENNIEL